MHERFQYDPSIYPTILTIICFFITNISWNLFFQRFWRRSLFMESTIKWISKEKKCMWPYCSFRSCLCTSKSANRSFRVCVWVTTIKSPFKFHKLLCQHFMKCPKKTGQFEEFKYFFQFKKSLFWKKKALCILTDKTMPMHREYFLYLFGNSCCFY